MIHRGRVRRTHLLPVAGSVAVVRRPCPNQLDKSEMKRKHASTATLPACQGGAHPTSRRFRLSCSVGSVVAEALGSRDALPRLKSCSQTVNEIPPVFVIDADGGRSFAPKEVVGHRLGDSFLVVDGQLQEHKPGEGRPVMIRPQGLPLGTVTV